MTARAVPRWGRLTSMPVAPPGSWECHRSCQASPSQHIYRDISPGSLPVLTKDSKRKPTALLIILFHSLLNVKLNFICMHYVPTLTQGQNVITLSLIEMGPYWFSANAWREGDHEFKGPSKGKWKQCLWKTCQHFCKRKLIPTVIKVQHCAPCSGNTSTPPTKTETLHTVSNASSPTGDDRHRPVRGCGMQFRIVFLLLDQS